MGNTRRLGVTSVRISTSCVNQILMSSYCYSNNNNYRCHHHPTYVSLKSHLHNTVSSAVASLWSPFTDSGSRVIKRCKRNKTLLFSTVFIVMGTHPKFRISDRNVGQNLLVEPCLQFGEGWLGLALGEELLWAPDGTGSVHKQEQEVVPHLVLEKQEVPLQPSGCFYRHNNDNNNNISDHDHNKHVKLIRCDVHCFWFKWISSELGQTCSSVLLLFDLKFRRLALGQ